MFKTSLFGVLGCEMRLKVASQPMRPPPESPGPGNSLPISANASALPWDSDPALRSGTPDGRGAASLNVVSKAPGKFRDGELGWLASTCCNASARPPYQVPAVEKIPSGSVRPAPASCDTL